MKNDVCNLNGRYYVRLPANMLKRYEIQPGYYDTSYSNGMIILTYICSLKDNIDHLKKDKTKTIVTLTETLRFTIPKEYRYDYDTSGSVVLGYDPENRKLYCRPNITSCVFCGVSLNLSDFGNKKICRDCIKSIIDTFSVI